MPNYGKVALSQANEASVKLEAYMNEEIALNPAYLKNINRAPRILIVSDSINNSPYILPRIRADFPGASIERRSYSGSKSPIGLFLASDVQALITGGQLLPNTDTVGVWTPKNSVMTKDFSPSTGKSVTQIVTSGVGGQGISVQTRPVVPTGAPPLVFSLMFEPGTIQSFRVNIVNVTKGGGVIVSSDFPPSEIMDTRGGLLSRYSIPMKSTDGATYSAGDTLAIDILLGSQESYKAGKAYIDEPMLNVGQFPAPYRATAGVSEPVGAEEWSSLPGGTNRNLFDLAVITLGRNDTDNISFYEYEMMAGSIISGLSKHVARVLFCTPPPQANSGLTAFVSNDPYQSKGFVDALKRACYKHGAFFYDAVEDFKNTAKNGTPVNVLMRDTIHPTDADVNSAGIGRYVKAIIDVLTQDRDKRPSPLTKQPTSQIGGQVVSGTWSWKKFTAGTAPLNDSIGLFTGHLKEPNSFAFSSSEVGAKIKYRLTGTILGFVILNDKDTPGIAKVTVDGVPQTNISFSGSGTSRYPTGVYVTGGLVDTEHEIVVEVVSGEVRMLAAVMCSGGRT